jgi:alpha-L-rhamnosidase
MRIQRSVLKRGSSPFIPFKRLGLSGLLALLATESGLAAPGDLKPVDLRCEYAVNPLGIDVPQPRFFWQLESHTPGQRQTAWQVIVSTSKRELAKDNGDLWDSAQVDSGEQTHIRYSGRDLHSSQRAFWKVRVWDADRKESVWSEPAEFTMGVLNESDWKARWIAAPTNCATLLMRREFTVKPGLKRAVIHLCGLGQYELTLNGRKSDEDLLSPGWTKYDKTCLYETRDITKWLKTGPNAIGIELGNGMYNVTGGRYVKFKGSFGPLKAIAQLRLEYDNGSVEIVGTDEQWRVHSGPITFSCTYGGEDYDARLEPKNWNSAGFDESSWMSAIMTNGPGGKLRGLSCAAPPLRTFEEFNPVSSKSLSNEATVYDLGQNAALMPRIHVHGPAGSRVRIIPAELLKPDGSVDRGSVSGGRPGWWQYTLAGAGDESWIPKFTYNGARYVQVERYPASVGGKLPEVESIAGVVVHSSSEPVGEFECSNELFNRIRKLIRWAQRSNMMSVLTDCPHREKLGWLEQYHLNGPSLRYEFDLNQLFAKGMNDMEDCQLADGFVPNIAPEYVVFGKGSSDESNAFRNSPEWGSAFIIVPWQQYEFTGDVDLLRQHYESMKRYVGYLENRATNHIVSFGLGDWYDIGPKALGPAQLTPIALTATAFYFYDTHILAETARLLGKEEDAKMFSARADEIRHAFNERFYDTTNHSYATGSQCADAIPLVMNLVDSGERETLVNAIAADVRSRTNAVSAGDVGYRYLLQALAEGGYSDVIFDMNNQSDKPGYGYQLKKGATSLTEAWDARRSSSQNHFMLGQIMEWFYRDLAGIGPDLAQPGFRNILIRPRPAGDLSWAKASYHSIRGRIESSWRREKDQFTLDVTLPPNTTGVIRVPGTGAKLVQPSGNGSDKLVRLELEEGNASTFAVQSGHYRFRSRWR